MSGSVDKSLNAQRIRNTCDNGQNVELISVLGTLQYHAIPNMSFYYEQAKSDTDAAS